MDLRGMAREHIAVRRDQHQLRPHPPMQGLGYLASVIIRGRQNSMRILAL